MWVTVNTVYLHACKEQYCVDAQPTTHDLRGAGEWPQSDLPQTTRSGRTVVTPKPTGCH